MMPDSVRPLSLDSERRSRSVTAAQECSRRGRPRPALAARSRTARILATLGAFGLAVLVPCAVAPSAAAVTVSAAAPIAASSAVSPSDILNAMNVASAPTTYIVLVDVSGSMLDGDLFDSVRGELRSIVRQLHPGDSIAVDTFGDSPLVVRPLGAVSAAPDPAGALDGVSVDPLANTDMGGALALALQQLSSQPRPQIGVVLLLTDGKPDVPPSGHYYLPGINSASTPAELESALRQSPNWHDLQTGFGRLAPGTTVFGAGVALRPGLDLSPVLDDVFANPIVDDQATTPTLQQFIAAAQQTVQQKQAIALLAADSGQGVTATVSVPGAASAGGLPLRQGSISASVTFQSSTGYVPLVVSGASLSSASGDNLSVSATGLPSSILVPAGKSVTEQVMLNWPRPSGQSFDGGSFNGRATLQVTGQVSSPWADAIRAQFDKSFAVGTINTQPTTIAGSMTQAPNNFQRLLVALVLLLVMAAALFMVLRSFRRLDGSLGIRLDGTTFIYDLPHTWWTRTHVEMSKESATIQIRSARSRSKGVPAMRITCSATDGVNTRRHSKICDAGEMLILAGGWEIQHRKG